MQLRQPQRMRSPHFPLSTYPFMKRSTAPPPSPPLATIHCLHIAHKVSPPSFFIRYGSLAAFAVMCPATPLWQNTLADTVGKLVNMCAFFETKTSLLFAA